MLQKLHIINYAIIAEIEIDFSNGFSIITGETGAGKSILLGALSLILGERADVTVLLDKEKKCMVEGFFALPKNTVALHSTFKEMDIDLEDAIVIRREILPTAKSRAFINDTPVNLSQLKKVSSLLVDLHQQFDTLEVGEQDFQREVVDCIADANYELAQYQKAYKQLVIIQKELLHLKEVQQLTNKSLDYNQYLYNELEEANLQPNELELLEEELKTLNNAEHIKASLLQITIGLNTGEQPLLQQLKQIVNNLKSLSGFNKNLEDLHKRIQATNVELIDVADELEKVNDNLSLDVERIEMVNDKINSGYKLLKKHNVQTTEHLLEIKKDLAFQIQSVANADEEIKKKEIELNQITAQTNNFATKLHTKRVQVKDQLSKNINELLHKIGMPNAQVKVEITETKINEYGNSHIEFLFDANKSNKFEPIRKVASGGELSRLMLCIKSLVAGAMQLPVLIFDEIDTGISGEAARQVGIIMEGLAKQHQIICITHQAQIAAKANTHYFVHKAIVKDKIITSIKILNNDERITTIAQMLSGEKPTAAALQNAREMVGN